MARKENALEEVQQEKEVSLGSKLAGGKDVDAATVVRNGKLNDEKNEVRLFVEKKN